MLSPNFKGFGSVIFEVRFLGSGHDLTAWNNINSEKMCIYLTFPVQYLLENKLSAISIIIFPFSVFKLCYQVFLLQYFSTFVTIFH